MVLLTILTFREGVQMERLTDWLDEETKTEVSIMHRKMREAMIRLAQYEDTGLTPEEIMDGRMLTGWIPVSERLPVGKEFEIKAGKRTLYRTVLVQTDSHNMHTAYYNAAEQVWRDDTGIIRLNVVAWRLFPEMFSEGKL